jgi:hypothetical protein
MTFDRRRQRRYAGDGTAVSQRAVESSVAHPAVDGPPDSSAVAGVSAAEIPEPPANLPARPVDAPYAHAGSAVVPARVVGRVGWDEAIAAITGFSMLAGALQQLGLETKTRGYFMSVEQPSGSDQRRLYELVVLGHHPHGGRLWWWLILTGSVSPDGAWNPPAFLRAIGPVAEIATVAEHIVRKLRVDAQSQGRGQDCTVRPAHDWPMT